MADALSIIPSSVVRNLPDKLYEKRKHAALEIEGIVKQLQMAGEVEKITAVINILTTEFTYSPQANHRKGGMIGIAAVAVGLSSDATHHLEKIVPPVLNCFLDQDSRVRYYACEALYNIAKIVRGEFVLYFNQIFDALCKLAVDSDPSVQSAAHLLDRLVKDIVTESDQFSIEEFIPLLRERMNIINPYVRQFLVGWITVLDSVPVIDMLGFLPDFLDGLFNMLSDPSHEIRQQADSSLSEFLQEIKNSPNVDYGRMAEILVKRARSLDEFTRLTAITWINEFVHLGGDQLVPYYASILGAILPCVSAEEEKTRVVALGINEELRKNCAFRALGFDVRAILSVVKGELASRWEATKIEALHWIGTLLDQSRPEVIPFLNDIFGALLSVLSDPSDEVILLVLEVHSCIARDLPHVRQLVVFLMHNFRTERTLLEKSVILGHRLYPMPLSDPSVTYIIMLQLSFRRGSLIIRRLCVLLDAERVYREFSMILEHEDDLEFASTLVQALNLIMLTSSELADLRVLLKQSLVTISGKDLFVSLYASWCHSALATIGLCLLAQAYQHASAVIFSLGEEHINMRFLVQLDKLVRLLETPIFVYLRLQLLEPGRNIYLLRALYGLLSLLPQQSESFKILKTRLKAVPKDSFGDNKFMWGPSDNLHVETLQISEGGENYDVNNLHNAINFPSRLQQFKNIQCQHQILAKSQLHTRLMARSRRSKGRITLI